MRRTPLRSLVAAAVLAAIALTPSASVGHGKSTRHVTLVTRDTPIAEIFEMISAKEKINIILGSEVEGSISVSFYDVPLVEAITAIAEAAGYVAERRHLGWAIVPRGDVGDFSAEADIEIRAFTLQYVKPEEVLPTIKKHLSRFGDASTVRGRKMLVVEDTPGFMKRIARLIREIDAQPQQILLEARILEISLDDSQSLGIDWSHAFSTGDGAASFGVKDFGGTGAAGAFFSLMDGDLEIALNALTEDGRVRTLSNPRLLALENRQARVVIGDRLGYRVTTTINEVTTESVEFLESGVILTFTAAVDEAGRIVLDVHPEVSSGRLDDGLPEQKTTEVTTQFVTEDGASIFIGGLLNDQSTQGRKGIPYLMNIPLLGRLFSSSETIDESTETVVILTPRIVGTSTETLLPADHQMLEETERELRQRREWMGNDFSENAPVTPAGTVDGAIAEATADAPASAD